MKYKVRLLKTQKIHLDRSLMIMTFPSSEKLDGEPRLSIIDIPPPPLPSPHT